MNGLIFFKRAGHLVAEAYLAKALPSYKTCIGAAALDHKSSKFEIAAMSPGVDLPVLMEMQERYKDQDVLFHIGDAKHVVQEDDLMPFIALGDSDNILAVGAVEGMFVRNPPEGRTDEGQLVADYLVPKFDKIFKTTGASITKFFLELKDKLTEQELKNTWAGAGTIVLFGNTGETARIEDNTQFREFDWGWTTNHVGYDASELKIEASTIQATASPRMFGKATPVAAAPSPTPAPAKPLPDGVHSVPKPTTSPGPAAPAPDTAEGVWARPPSFVMGDAKKLKRWYPKAQGKNGQPPDFMNGPAVFISNSRLEKLKVERFQFRQVANAKGDPLPDSTQVEAPKPDVTAPSAPLAPAPIEAPKPNPEVYRPMEPERTLPLTPIVAPEDLEAFKAFQEKISARGPAGPSVGLSSMELAMDPAKLQGLENKLPTFLQRTKLDKAWLYGLHYDDIVEFVNKHGNLATVLLFNLLCSAAKIDKAAGTLPATNNKPASAPTTVPAVPQVSASRRFGQQQAV